MQFWLQARQMTHISSSFFTPMWERNNTANFFFYKSMPPPRRREREKIWETACTPIAGLAGSIVKGEGGKNLLLACKDNAFPLLYVGAAK